MLNGIIQTMNYLILIPTASKVDRLIEAILLLKETWIFLRWTSFISSTYRHIQFPDTIWYNWSAYSIYVHLSMGRDQEKQKIHSPGTSVSKREGWGQKVHLTHNEEGQSDDIIWVCRLLSPRLKMHMALKSLGRIQNNRHEHSRYHPYRRLH